MYLDLHKLQEERFYELKHVLTTVTTEFIWGKINPYDHERLQTIFAKRTGKNVSEKAKPMMYHFYTLFMHRYENGLRGIEWFYKEKGSYLETNLKTMANTWTSLKFRLVHSIEFNDELIIFEDVITKKTYPVANTQGNVPSTIGQYYGTIGLLELNNNKYYFNGVKVFLGPKHVSQAKRKVESIMKDTALSYDEVMMEYSAEVLAVMLAEDKQFQFQEEDVLLLEELGLEHLPAYAEDLLAFYKEKTTGKKENTVRKYRESLHDFNEVLKRNQAVDLNEIDEEVWKKLLSKEYFDMYKTMTKTQITDLISTIKAFVQWMKRNKKGALWPGLVNFLKVEENQFIHAVQLPNSFFPNRTGDFGVKFYELSKLYKGEIVKDGQVETGLFEIIKCNKQSFRVARLASLQKDGKGTKRAEYTITGVDLHMEYVEVGLIFAGKISKGRSNLWELLQIDEAYPRAAKTYLACREMDVSKPNKLEV